MGRPHRFTPAGVPLHITQRGNFADCVFFCDADFRLFLQLLDRYSGENEVAIHGYCLMPNHYHLVAVPESDLAVSAMMQSLNSAYARALNFRLARSGHVWQARYGSFAMDLKHLRSALAYVDLNPVRAGITPTPEEYPWSSAAAHLGLVNHPSFLEANLFARSFTSIDWRGILDAQVDRPTLFAMRKASRAGTAIAPLDGCHVAV